MSIHKKNIIILILLDIAYVLLSVNIVLSYYFADNTSWYAYLPFVVILGLGIGGYILYRKDSQALLPITKWQFTFTRILTFAFLIVYLVQMFVIPNPTDYQVALSYLVGGVLMLIALGGLSLHLYILLKGFKK